MLIQNIDSRNFSDPFMLSRLASHLLLLSFYPIFFLIDPQTHRTLRLTNRLQVHIPLDPSTNQPKGLAYITFASPDEAVAAYEALDKTSFQGRLIHILGAVDRRGAAPNPGEGGKKVTVKGEREAKRKAVAGKEFNWSMLYMNVSRFFLRNVNPNAYHPDETF